MASQMLAAIPLFSHMDEEEHQELHALMLERTLHQIHRDLLASRANP